MTTQLQTLNSYFNDKFYASRKAFRFAVRRFAETQNLYYTNQRNHYYLVIDQVEYSIGYSENSMLSYVTTIKVDTKPTQSQNEQLPGHALMTKIELISEINKIAGEYLGHGNVTILGLTSMTKAELLAKFETYTLMIVLHRRYLELFTQQSISPKDSWKFGMQPEDEQPNWYREAVINRQRAANVWATGHI